MGESVNAKLQLVRGATASRLVASLVFPYTRVPYILYIYNFFFLRKKEKEQIR